MCMEASLSNYFKQRITKNSFLIASLFSGSWFAGFVLLKVTLNTEHLVGFDCSQAALVLIRKIKMQ